MTVRGRSSARSAATIDDVAVLRVEDLVVQFPRPHGARGARMESRRAVDGASLAIQRRETVALVGESGSGKTTLARAIMGLGPPPLAGHVYVRGRESNSLAPSERKTRCGTLQMVFQSPSGSLNPRMRVRQSIAEPLVVHGMARQERTKRVDELLEAVGLSRTQGDRLPSELSGGQQQRVGIARALALSPSLLVLDEPLSALDVSVQAQIVNLLLDLQSAFGLSYLFISHDLAVVAGLAHRVAVMYMGRIVEIGPASEVLTKPVHPYTCALLSAVPIAEPQQRVSRNCLAVSQPQIAGTLSGTVQQIGCAFSPRCCRVQPKCIEQTPQLAALGLLGGHQHACHFPEETSSPS